MRAIAALLTGLWAVLAVPAQGTEVAGRFDYYVLSLSWSSNWCRLTGDAQHAAECAAGRHRPFVLHGLWPESDTSYPADCRTTAADPSKAETAAMADVMGSAGLAWHEWQKHGRCSGLSSGDYFALARKAFTAISLPTVLQQLNHDVRVKPSVVADAILSANPQLSPADLIVTCDQGAIQEVRICLTKDLSPRPCSPHVGLTCTLPAAQLDAVR